MLDEVKLPDDTVVQGLGHRSFFVPGALDAKGNAAWSVDGKNWFELDIQASRYQRCLECAHELKEQYPMDGLDPDKPADLQKIAANEEAITTALNRKIHQEYGDYNPMIAAGADSRTHSSMHGDIDRSGSTNPTGLEEFNRGELICRHFAPLANALCTEAGMNVARMDSVFTVDYEVRSDGVTQKRDVGFHTAVVSMTTGNVIEATARQDGTPYKRKVNDISVEDILAGKTLIVGDEQKLTALGPGNFSGITDNLLAGRRESITSGKFDLLPTRQQYSGGIEAHNSFKNNEIAPEFRREIQEVFDQKVRGATAKFETAVDQAIASGKSEDVAKIRECCEQMPVSDYAMANVLNRSVKAQNWELTELLLDQGAVKGFGRNFDTGTLPLILDGRQADPQFVKQLLDKTNTSLESYQRNIDAYNRSDQNGIIERLRSDMHDMSHQPASPQKKIVEAEQVVAVEPAKAPSMVTEEKKPPVEASDAAMDKNNSAEETKSLSAPSGSIADALTSKVSAKQKIDSEKADSSVKTSPEETQQERPAVKRAGTRQAMGGVDDTWKPSQDAQDQVPGQEKTGLEKWISAFLGDSGLGQIVMMLMNIVSGQMTNNNTMETAVSKSAKPTKQMDNADQNDKGDSRQNIEDARRAADQLKASGKLAGSATGSHVADGTEVAAIVPRGKGKISNAQIGG